MKTRDTILKKAKQLFNKNGVGNVTVRNICNELKISLGNFTYYFPDKQQIIVELYLGMIAALEEIDKKINVSRETIIYLLEYHRQTFVIETDFRFFYLNTFEILNSNPAIREAYLQHVQNEKKRMKQLLNIYVKNGVLINDMSEQLIDKIINVSLIIGSFWMIDAEVQFKGKEKQKLLHYLELCCSIIEAYLTKNALAEYHSIFKELNDI
jgi:AcrR family transcriptional regulator